MNLFALSGLLLVVTNAVMVVLMFVRGRQKLHYIWGIFCATAFMWGLGGYKIATTIDMVKADFWWRITHIGVIFIPILFTHFVFEFLKIKRKWFVVTIYSLGFLFLATNFINGLFIANMRWVFNQFYYDSPPGPFYVPFTVMFFALVAYSLIKLWQAYRMAQGMTRTQIKYFFFGMLISFAGGGLSFLPVYKIDLYPVFNITAFLFTIIVGYTILKYRFMDIRIVTRKIFIYLGVAAFTYGMFYLVAWLYLRFFGGIFTKTAYLSGLVIAPLFVGLFYLLNRALQKFTSKYLFVSLSNYQESITKLSQELNYYIQLNKLIDLIVRTIQDTMQLQRAGVLLIEQQKDIVRYKIAKVIGFNKQNGISLVQDNFLTRYLQKNRKPLVKDEIGFLIGNTQNVSEKENFARLQDHMTKIEAALCLPLVRQNNLIGIIVLGPKLSGDAYTKEDLELLSTLSNQAGIAIDNARLYSQVQDFSRTLKQKVDEQTKDIKEKNIYLQDLLKMKGEFLDVASHQLKTPISITRGYLSMVIAGDYKDDKQKETEALKNALIGIERLNDTTKDFLDAHDLEGKEIELKLAETDLAAFIQGIVAEKEVLAKNKKIELAFIKPDQKLPLIKIDPSLLNQALSNLVDNAIFYTNKGSVKVSLSLNTAQNEIAIKIADTGIGISPEDKNKLFEKFSRCKNAILTKPDGSGLGLYIAKKLVEAHKGRIELASELEKGTTFSVILSLTNLS